MHTNNIKCAQRYAVQNDTKWAWNRYCIKSPTALFFFFKCLSMKIKYNRCFVFISFGLLVNKWSTWFFNVLTTIFEWLNVNCFTLNAVLYILRNVTKLIGCASTITTAAWLRLGRSVYRNVEQSATKQNNASNLPLIENVTMLQLVIIHIKQDFE